jgi:hypothetical protein
MTATNCMERRKHRAPSGNRWKPFNEFHDVRNHRTGFAAQVSDLQSLESKKLLGIRNLPTLANHQGKSRQLFRFRELPAHERAHRPRYRRVPEKERLTRFLGVTRIGINFAGRPGEIARAQKVDDQPEDPPPTHLHSSG